MSTSDRQTETALPSDEEFAEWLKLVASLKSSEGFKRGLVDALPSERFKEAARVAWGITDAK